MVWKSGTLVLLVSDHPDNAQHRSVFHRTLAVDGESKQRLVAFSLLLSADDSVPQLWQDALDFVHLPVFRRLSDCAALSVRTVHHRCRYVSESGNHQFEWSDGVAGQLITGHSHRSHTLHSCSDIGHDFNYPQAPAFCGIYSQRTEESLHPAWNLSSHLGRSLLGRLPLWTEIRSLSSQCML